MGPKFVLTPSQISREALQHSVQIETATLAYSLRWHATATSMVRNNTGPMADVKKACPFHSTRKEPPRTHMDTEKAIQGFQMDLQRLVEKFRMVKPVSNLPPAERKAVIELRSQPDTTITRSDKGGELVVMKTSTLHQMCLDHLSDSTTYTRFEKNVTKSI